MWATYDYSKKPLIIVNFNGKIENDKDFKNFLDEWGQLYKEERYFSFIFDTTMMETTSIKYVYQMTKFISKLKKEKIQYLCKNIIIIKNSFIRFFINIIFCIQSPVATVYLIDNNNNNNSFVEKLLHSSNITDVNKILRDNYNKIKIIN